jgi:murein DD-endopeptidase MepM/ murein hydrolase activator NlpD
LDIRGRLGTSVVAADSGYVVAAGWQGPYGNAVIIDHGNGFQTLYAHLASIVVTVGNNVVKGDTIGLLGTTGNSTGPHVHFEIHQGKLRLNPINFLPIQ